MERKRWRKGGRDGGKEGEEIAIEERNDQWREGGNRDRGKEEMEREKKDGHGEERCRLKRNYATLPTLESGVNL